jgi:hypothetical protein
MIRRPRPWAFCAWTGSNVSAGNSHFGQTGEAAVEVKQTLESVEEGHSGQKQRAADGRRREQGLEANPGAGVYPLVRRLFRNATTSRT